MRRNLRRKTLSKEGGRITENKVWGCDIAGNQERLGTDELGQKRIEKRPRDWKNRRFLRG